MNPRPAIPQPVAVASEARALAFLADLSETLAVSLDLRETLSEAVNRIADFMDAEAAVAYGLVDSVLGEHAGFAQTDFPTRDRYRRAIEEFARHRTTFLVTHSLGSLQFADRIVLMNAGRIEAVGTESELRRHSHLYRRLHEIHFQRESA